MWNISKMQFNMILVYVANAMLNMLQYSKWWEIFIGFFLEQNVHTHIWTDTNLNQNYCKALNGAIWFCCKSTLTTSTKKNNYITSSPILTHMKAYPKKKIR